MARQNRVNGSRASDSQTIDAPCVLVIDDDADMRNLLMYQLTVAGYRGVGAATGIAGVRAARSIQPDMIVLDLNLPDMHGLDVLRMLRSEPLLEKTPVVVVSGERSIVAAQALVEGADGLFRKPIEFDDLVTKFRSLNCVAPEMRG